jgi:transaldolase/glucose-6-phosphate isomerase
LIGNHTVNTIPPQTLEAFKDHGKVSLTIEKDLDGAKKAFSDLERIGISMKKVTRELEEEGVQTFSESNNSLLAAVKIRREDALIDLGPLAKSVSTRIAKFESDQFLSRFYAMDGSLWTDDPKGQEEVRIRMGWLNLPDSSKALLPGLNKFYAEIRDAGFTQALLLGMGGSSLAPEVMSLIFQSSSGLKLSILDSTDPDQVLSAARKNPVRKTLFIVSSKSGGTADIFSRSKSWWAIFRSDGLRSGSISVDRCGCGATA